MEFTTLNNGIQMPMEGFGVFQVSDLATCEQAVLDAIDVGYRMIDTAAAYGNEEAVGAAIRKCGVPREELFITTKMWINQASYEGAKAAFSQSLSKLGLDYLDLYLIHQPLGDYYGAWRALEELYQEGKVRAIGVSNFYPDRLTDFCLNVNVIPAVNQIELHPFLVQEEALAVMKEFGVTPQAWAPLAQAKQGIFDNEVLSQIAKKYGKTVAQVALRWNVQRGVVVIPKSVHRERIMENADIWDFALDEGEMAAIGALDVGRSELADLREPGFVKFLFGA